MALRTASPWWLSAVYLVGLVLIFIGERAFGHEGSVRLLFTGLGALGVIGATAARIASIARSSRSRRAVEKTLLWCHLGGLVGLVGYVLTTGWGRGLVGAGALTDKSLERYMVPLTVLWVIIIVAAIVPMLMAEIALGTANRTAFATAKGAADDAGVEHVRVREMVGSGITLALAAALLMATCNYAQQKNIRKDVSYFKTSAPGTSTLNIVKNMSGNLRVLVFFPEVNEVKTEVVAYFQELARMTGKVDLEVHDRMVSAKIAQDFRVSKDGQIVLARGDEADTRKTHTLSIDPDINKARRMELRNLDGKVNAGLMTVARDKRTAYLTVGHGEINDADSLGEKLAQQFPDASAKEIKTKLSDLNYKVENLGLATGLGREVPADASVVLVLAPKTPLLEEEIASLKRYVQGGGALLVALDPLGKGTLGELEPLLGVSFDPVSLADDKEFLPQRGNASDRALILTNQFSAHASITSASRGDARAGVLLVNSGTLREVDFAPVSGDAPKRTHVIRSMVTSWRDENRNFTFDEGAEKRDRYNVATTIEGPAIPAEGGTVKNGYRAMVFADGELFSDPVVMRVPLAGNLFSDAVKWLGGEEVYAGETISEKDVYIRHTRGKDVVWFYLTIVGAPVLVLTLGLLGIYWRRRRAGRSS